jgi:hypothetical protein
MKKSICLIAAVCVLSVLLGGSSLAGTNDDIQAIKKAVKDNPNYEPGKEVKWFKLLVTDNKTNKDKVRITLPISLVEVFVKCAENKHVKLNREDCDIDLQAMLAELKKIGPMAIIEVYEDDETVKVWLE